MASQVVYYDDTRAATPPEISNPDDRTSTDAGIYRLRARTSQSRRRTIQSEEHMLAILEFHDHGTTPCNSSASEYTSTLDSNLTYGVVQPPRRDIEAVHVTPPQQSVVTEDANHYKVDTLVPPISESVPVRPVGASQTRSFPSDASSQTS